VRTSDLVAGGPVYPTVPLQPTATSTVAFGNLHAYVEAYGASAASTTVRFDVARALESPALVAADALVRPAGGDRAIFTQVTSVQRLPPGRYVLRAIVNADGCQRTGQGSRRCTLATDLVIPTSPAAAQDEMFLPVGDERLAALFAQAAVLSDAGDERSDLQRSVNELAASRQLGAARDRLEHWAATWPDDLRFAKPLALVYATFGRALDALRLLERHLAAYPDDVDALGLAVEWLYALHAGGTSTSSPDTDLDLARRYAASYRDKNWPEGPLVQLWLDYMSSSPSR
jgi:hypothetical protein